MFNLFSLFSFKAGSQKAEAYDYDKAPRQTLALSSGHAIIIYKFKTIWMIMDAKAEWRNIEGVAPGTRRKTIELIANAYFSGFEQAEIEKWTKDHQDFFEEEARRYQEELSRTREH